MNRRELFKGLAASFVAANIPIQVEVLEAAPFDSILTWLRAQQTDLFYKIMNPPCIMHEDGTIEFMKVDVWQDALSHVNKLIKELE